MPKGEKLPILAPDVEPGEISKSVDLALHLASMPKVDIKDAGQIRQRCEDYFNFCQENDLRPGVQGLCLALGSNRQSLLNWENEQTERGEIIRQSKQIMRYLLENWSLSGKLSPPTAIFWAKNQLGMSDSIRIEAVPADNVLQADKTPEQIQRELIEQIPVDDFDE